LTVVNGFALVTSTSAGIGAEVAAQLLRHGWSVVGVSRRAASLTDARYRHLSIDLEDLSMLGAIEEEVAPRLRDAAWSRVGLVNNAAYAGHLGPAQLIDPAELMKLYAVNVAAPIGCMGLIARHCKSSVPLRIVNLSSAAARQAFPGLAAYGSAKAALRMAGMVLAAEWQSTAPHAPTRRNASILSYEPGAVDTAMQTGVRAIQAEAFPWVDLFIGLADRGMLVPPAAPAAEIVAFLEADGEPVFAERRLGAGLPE
jgi:benzil reductase ((S)-benzoin forming)